MIALSLVLTIWGCGGEPAPTGPDPAASAAAADAVCKLLQGATESCTAHGSTVSWGDRTIDAKVTLLSEETKLGQTNFSARVDLAEGGRVYSSPAVGFGWAREEAFKKGFHEWAVVTGVAVVDAWLDRPERPALRALTPESAPPAGAEKLGAFDLFLGFTVLRGDKPPADGIDQAGLVGALAPLAPALAADAPHVLTLHRTSGVDGVTLTCHVDGLPSEALCQHAGAFVWPTGSSWEVKQSYVVAPAR